MELAIYIHRSGLADKDIRGDNAIGEILDEGFSFHIIQTGNLTGITDACKEIPCLLLSSKRSVETVILWLLNFRFLSVVRLLLNGRLINHLLKLLALTKAILGTQNMNI